MALSYASPRKIQMQFHQRAANNLVGTARGAVRAESRRIFLPSPDAPLGDADIAARLSLPN